MSTYTFEVVIEEDEFEDGRPAYHAYCPALPGCRTWGHTYKEAETNIREAVSLYVEDMIEAGDEVPKDGVLLDGDIPRTSVAVIL